MNKEVYLILRKASIFGCTEELMSAAIEESGLDYRTLRALVRIINNETGITKEDIEKLMDPDFYTMDNMVRMYSQGLKEIIPTHYFENEEFLEKANVEELPDRFIENDRWIRSFTIDRRIKRIGARAFAGCINLEDISFSTWGLEEIGEYAFEDDENFKTGYLPESIKKIGAGAYKGCSGLDAFCIPGNICRIESYTFEDCTSLCEVVTQEKIDIGKHAFRNCRRLERISGVIGEIEEEGLCGCSSLKEIELETSVIGERALAGCTSLETLHFRKIPALFERDCLLGATGLQEVRVDGISCEFRETRGYGELTRNIRPKKEDGNKKFFLFTSSVHETLTSL